jgi:hypothetical protein
VKTYSLLKRFAIAETMAVSFFLALEALAYGGMQLVRHVDPGAGDEFLVSIDYFWELMASTGIVVALVVGGPSYLLCARWMASRRLPLWVAGSLTVVGGLLLFALALGDSLDGGCGGG